MCIDRKKHRIINKENLIDKANKLDRGDLLKHIKQLTRLDDFWSSVKSFESHWHGLATTVKYDVIQMGVGYIIVQECFELEK